MRSRNGGFTLVELIVASALISLVMASVYTALNTTLRISELANLDTLAYPSARTALGVLERELNCIVGGSQHLFEGTRDSFQFFAVVPPMDSRKGHGSRVMWIRYRYSRAQRAIIREEALVKDTLPMNRRSGEDFIAPSRVKLGRKRKFNFLNNVRRFQVSYCWMPPPRRARRRNEPPIPIDPVVLEQNHQGWGLPQGMRMHVTIVDPNTQSGEMAFDLGVTFPTGSTAFNRRRLGLDERSR